MTNKTTMPKPVAYAVTNKRHREFSIALHHDASFAEGDNDLLIEDLITTKQAEAYANAMVKQTLEEAAKILDNESERYEQKAQEIMHDDPDEVPHMRSTAWCLSVCARDIRALIPKEDA